MLICLIIALIGAFILAISVEIGNEPLFIFSVSLMLAGLFSFGYYLNKEDSRY
jgi:drug/metabolite transporter (DMT)-like permease